MAYSLEEFIELLGSRDYETRAQAEASLLDHGAEAVDLLIAVVQRGEGMKSCIAAKLLAKLDEKRAVDVMIMALASSNVMLRQVAARLLGDLGNARAVGPLIKTVQQDVVIVQLWAVSSLGSLGDPRVFIPLVAELTKTASATLRYTIIQTLGNLGDRRALPVIERYVDDEDHHVRKRAKEAVEKLKNLG